MEMILLLMIVELFHLPGGSAGDRRQKVSLLAWGLGFVEVKRVGGVKHTISWM